MGKVVHLADFRRGSTADGPVSDNSTRATENQRAQAALFVDSLDEHAVAIEHEIAALQSRTDPASRSRRLYLMGNLREVTRQTDALRSRWGHGFGTSDVELTDDSPELPG